MSNVHFSSITDQWSTPQEFFDRLNLEYRFTLDPCATDENHKCDKYYTIVDDGLSKSWDHEIVFMNPPYGREIGKWVEKARRSNATVVCLLPARTDTQWWHGNVIKYRAEVEFIKGRLKFGNSKNSAPFPSAIVVFHKEQS